jgi:alpha(1,3/1,4) fucosyltransferase
MIKVFKAEPMSFTLFANDRALDDLKAENIAIASEAKNCDLFISRFLRNLIPYAIKYPSKKFLLYTHEPRYNTFFVNKTKKFLTLPSIHVFNAYTGIYTNNYQYEWAIKNSVDFLDETNFPDFKNKKIVALMTCGNNKRKYSLKRDGKEIDLIYLRTQIALQGYREKKLDIYGKGWQKSIAIENSRHQSWTSRKSEILANYHFNLCFENTNIDYYCTEKIWQSIQGKCLPIYYGKGNKIYEDFPKNSFLDYCDFQNTQEMFEYIEKMDLKEFRDRLNLCIQVLNNIYEQKKTRGFAKEKLLTTAKKIKIIVNE